MQNNPIRAFSLVELMIVIAILAILVTLLVIGLGSYSNQAKFSEIFSVIQKYQIEANQAFTFTQTYPVNRTDTIGTNYIKTIAFIHGSNAKKAILYAYLDEFYPGWVDGQALLFVGDWDDQKQRINWTCCQHTTSEIQVPATVIPKTCSSTCSLD